MNACAINDTAPWLPCEAVNLRIQSLGVPATLVTQLTSSYLASNDEPDNLHFYRYALKKVAGNNADIPFRLYPCIEFRKNLIRSGLKGAALSRTVSWFLLQAVKKAGHSSPALVKDRDDTARYSAAPPPIAKVLSAESFALLRDHGLSCANIYDGFARLIASTGLPVKHHREEQIVRFILQTLSEVTIPPQHP